MSEGITGDFLAMDIRQALHYLGEITGTITTDDLLDNIFSKFCIDIYWKGQREYDYLNLYVKKSNKTSDNEQNRQTLLLADQIRAQRIIDLQSGKYKLKQPKTGISFIDYFNKLKTDRLNSKGNYGNWDSAYKHLMKFMKGKDLTLGEVDETWLLALKQYLLQDAWIAGGNIKLSQNSALSYFNKVKAALRQAFEEKLIQENPAVRVRSIKPAETKRGFLTWEEVQKYPLPNVMCAS